MNHKKQMIRVIIVLSLSFTLAARADYRVLHHFAGGASDGSMPDGSSALIEADSVLYGMTRSGGGYNNGTVFRINTDGAGFTLLHTFVSASSGIRPYGGLILSDSSLYGTVSSENTSYAGKLFRINTDGSDYQVLHSFAGPPGDGRWPYASLVQSGSALYGTTAAGGTYDNGSTCWGGTVFKIDTDGTDYQILHNFAGGANDGQWSYGDLLQAGDTLYGTTLNGGSSGNGTVFKIDTNGTGFQILHSFAGGSNDGAWPFSTLIQSGSTLYGTTLLGGINDQGTIFRINTDGTGYEVLHNFTGSAEDGSTPLFGALARSGSMLFGMTNLGGVYNGGVIFKMNVDGTGFQVVHSFAGGVNDGTYPSGSLFLSGLTLYGMTSAGGSNDLGVIFAMDVPVTCVNPPNNDLNGDCKVDFQDFAILASQWLDCGLEPASACN